MILAVGETEFGWTYQEVYMSQRVVNNNKWARTRMRSYDWGLAMRVMLVSTSSECEWILVVGALANRQGMV